MPSVEDRATLRGARVVLDDRAILRDVDLAIGPGITVVRGENGAGKTTLLRAIAGLVPLSRGTRAVQGDVLYLGHRPQLHRALSATQNLDFFARYRGLRADQIAPSLSAWGVADSGRSVDRLSAGQRRRVALARLEIERCSLVLLDEPFAELDDEAAAMLAVRIGVCADRGQSVVIATHGHAELTRYRTLHLADGTLAG